MGSETVHALRDVSLNIDRGEYVAIMGPSGSGKSTLMNLLGCLDTPTTGRYELNGTDVSEMDDNDLADVILVAYNFAQDPSFYDKLRHTFHWSAIQPDLPRVLDKARKKDIGVIAMKTLMGARLNDMRPYERPGATFSQAAFRWVLSAPQVDALLVSMSSASEIDEYVAASGTAQVSGVDLELLECYALLQSGRYCQSACNDCAGSCPQNVAIAEVLRTRMYDVDYGDALLARTEYAALGKPAEVCLNCTVQSCLNACTRGIPIAEYTRDAAKRLG